MLASIIKYVIVHKDSDRFFIAPCGAFTWSSSEEAYKSLKSALNGDYESQKDEYKVMGYEMTSKTHWYDEGTRFERGYPTLEMRPWYE